MYRRLGRTGLGVSPIALGTMGFGPPTSHECADQLVRSAIDLGVNLIDTANCYDGPKRGDVIHSYAEQMLGKILSAGLRDEVVLLSKVGVPLRSGPQHRGLSATHLMRELDASLQRLQTDYLDLYLIHWPDSFAHPEEVLRVVDNMVQQGKVRYFGVSNHQGWEVCEYLWMGDRQRCPMVSVNEIPFSMLDRHHENDLPFYDRHQVGVLAYQSLSGGLLSDSKRRKTVNGKNETSEAVAGWSNEPSDSQQATILKLGQLADKAGVTLSQLALAWVLAQPAVTSLVLGARKADHLRSAMEAANWNPPADVLAAIDEICPGPQKPQPRFER